MNFKIKRTILLDCLSKTTKAVSSKSPLPILTGIRFQLFDNKLVLTGSDSNISIQSTVLASDDLEIFKEGSVVLSAKFIYEIVRKINNDFITIEIIDGLLTRISGSNSEYNLNGSEASDYPSINLAQTGPSFTINALKFKELIAHTKFAASDKQTKPILTGINFKASNQLLECIATDSYRLARSTTSINDQLEFNITIPHRSLDELFKIIDLDEEMKVYVSDQRVLFIYDNTVIQSRLIEGTYPDTSRLIPDATDHILVVNSSDFMNSIDRVALISNELNSIITLNISNNDIKLSCYQQEIGSVEEDISDTYYKGDDLQISFSSKYVVEALRSFGLDRQIIINFSGEMRPFTLKDQHNDQCLHLVLPVRTY